MVACIRAFCRACGISSRYFGFVHRRLIKNVPEPLPGPNVAFVGWNDKSSKAALHVLEMQASGIASSRCRCASTIWSKFRTSRGHICFRKAFDDFMLNYDVTKYSVLYKSPCVI